MTRGLRVWIAVLCLLGLMPVMAQAGAWPTPVGETLIITRFETASADKRYDANHKSQPLSGWATRDLSLYGEYGFTHRVSLYAKVNAQDAKFSGERYKGLGAAEIGARYSLWKGDWSTLAIGAGVEGAGKGRRNESDLTRSRTTDTEIRLYGGQSFRLGSLDGYIDAQAARRFRSAGEPDQWRADIAVAIRPAADWLIMAQTYAGKTDRAVWGRSVWVNQELSVARHFGPKKSLTVQLSVRQTVYGENTPRVRAAAISLWKRF